jgi:hypothetical protein
MDINQRFLFWREGIKLKVNSPIRGLDKPRLFLDFEAPRFKYNRQMNVVRLSTLRTGHLYPGGISGVRFCQRAVLRTELFLQ